MNSVKLILILFKNYIFVIFFSKKNDRKMWLFSGLISFKKVVNFEHEFLEIGSSNPPLSSGQLLEDSQSFPTVCGMPMEIFFY